MNNLQTPLARKDGLVIQEMPDEVLVYDLNTNKAHCLNQTAAFVWKSCDGTKSISEINALMEREFGGKISEEMVWLAVDLLSKDNLLEHNIDTKFNGLSRREVIKKSRLDDRGCLTRSGDADLSEGCAFGCLPAPFVRTLQPVRCSWNSML